MAFTKDELVVFAARAGNIEKLRIRVSAGGDINGLSGAPLAAAIRAGQLSAVEWLLENGADVNAQYGDQTGPLEVALHNAHPEMVGVLVRAGARLRRRARPHYAARLEECLRLLWQARENASGSKTHLRKTRPNRRSRVSSGSTRRV